MAEAQARPTADTAPHLILLSFGNMPTAISHLTTLTKCGLNGASQPGREHFVHSFTQKSMQQYGQ